MSDDMGKWVAYYISLRDTLKLIDDKWEKERQQIVDVQNQVQGKIHQFLSDHNLNNYSTKHGTAHLSTRWSASLQDADEFMKFVIEKQAWDLLDRRANAPAVRQYIEDTNVTPPGVNLSAVQTVGVRRPQSK